MKKFLGILAATAVFASLAPTARAQAIVSLQYQTNGSILIGTGTAGVVPVDNWNVATLPYVGPVGTYSLSSLIDSTGAITGFSEDTYSFGGFDSSGGGSGMTGSDAKLFKGFALGNYGGAGDATLTLSGLDSAKYYRLITYVGQLFGGNATFSGSVAGNQTYFLKADASLSAYTQGTATTAGGAAFGNYFSFTGITGATSMQFTLDNIDSSTSSALFGFQLIETTVPEPSTCAMMLGGLSMLFAGQRIRRSRKS